MTAFQPTTILLRRRAALGDVILTTGIVRELYAKYQGQCCIDIVTDFVDVFQGNPYVRKAYHTAQLPAQDYDVVLNLDDAYECNPTASVIGAYSNRVFGTTAVDGEMELYASDAELCRVDSFIQDKIASDFIVIHMRNWHWALKNIAVEVWMDAINKVLAANCTIKIVCVGSKTDYCPTGHSRLVDGRDFSVQGLSYLMDHAKCFVGIDSAPFHVAGTSKAHIVALLSHMRPESILPMRNGVAGFNCTVIQAEVPCVGCYSRQQVPVRSIKCERNAKEQFICNRAWNTDKIVSAIVDHL